MPVLPGAEPFAHNGSAEIGVLLCHGFTGSPASMRPWGDRLAAEGFTVRCPLLPGHGTSWPEMNETTWSDWYATVDAALAELAGRCRSVFVFGLSMGGTLALRLAECHGGRVAGLVLVNPSVTMARVRLVALPVLARVIRSLPGISNDIARPGMNELAYPRTPLRAAVSLSRLWREVRRDLGRVTQPLLLLRSVTDHVVEPMNARIILAGVRSRDAREVLLPRSYHVATLDHDAPTVFDASIEFARRVHRERTEQTV